MFRISAICLGLVTAFSAPLRAEIPIPSYLDWNKIAELPPVGNQSQPLGVAGPFVGVHQDALIVAGGANFAPPHLDGD